ncbi:Ankyrin repeat protein 1 [Giardia duodenalis]|uniref:Ankyrin repeat protein 1 n=1 Tax=Giardia intestinalis (strain ATCC 50803 / WB clone C6) TaxID=184922 RepID=A8BLJ7_GIAIC|nr:Ankyrin repeat protein 1 [Giardia intestinalis]KAE8302773.1 Ankyrin repeat protein 1 [Giardia intestinalis]|eukprot:XP_001706308.1 Protein 21.1 [Giardia lamblia ATCC 50803]
MGAGASSVSGAPSVSPCAVTAAAVLQRLEGVSMGKVIEGCERGWLAKALMGAHLLTPDCVDIFERPPPIRGVYETTALIQAVKENDETLFDQYLTQLSFRTNSGRTALMYAAELGRQQMAERLLDEAEVVDLSGKTALIYALEAGHYDIADMLIPYEVGKAGVTDLMFYAQTGNLDALLAEQDDARAQDLSGHTALMVAVIHKNVKVAELLLEEMALTTTKGVTALMLAAQRGYGELVYLLATSTSTIEQPTGKFSKRTGQQRMRPVKLRELSNQTRDTGDSALMFAVKRGDILAACCLTEELYLQDCTGKTALMHAAERGDAEMVKFLCSLMKKGDRVQVDKKGRTALMYAAAQNYRAAAEQLFLREQRFQDKSGRTALSYALEHMAVDTISLLSPASVEGRFSKITQLMIDAACGKISEPLTPAQLVEVRQQDTSGRTALMYAVLAGHTKAIEHLCIEVEDFAHGHESVLQMCIEAQKLNCLQVLLLHVYEENVQINIPKLSLSIVDYETDLLAAAEKNDSFGARTHIDQAGKLCNGWTALMTAAYRGHIDIVKLLLCEVKLQNEKGWTALMLAVQTAQSEVVRLLARYELGLKDNEGETALVKAIRWNAIDMIEVLLREKHVLTNNRQTALSVAMEMGNEECLKLLKAPKL